MKFKKEYLVLIVIIAALGSYLAFHKSDNTHYQLPQLAKVTDKDITRMTIEKSGATVELKKTGEGWVIGPEGYPADKSLVEPMIKNVGSLALTALVSEGENYHPYDLDPDHRIQVTAWAGTSKVRDIAIGKTASSYHHTFVKLPDDARVFHAGENLRSAFEKDKASLRDKTVLAVEKTKIAKVEIKKGDKIRDLALSAPPAAVNVSQTKPDASKPAEAKPAPEKPTWKAASGESVDQFAVERLLDSVADLKCQSFIDGKKKTDFTAPIYTLTLNGDKPQTLSIYAKPENGEAYPATASGSDYPFNLSTYKAEEIMKYLVEEPKPAAGSVSNGMVKSAPATEMAKPAKAGGKLEPAGKSGKKTGKPAGTKTRKP